MVTPANALFVAAFGFVLVLLLHFSIAVSRLTDQSKILAQRLALLEERERELEAELAERDAPDAASRTGSRSRAPLSRHDVIVVGGGIVGLAVARALATRRRPDARCACSSARPPSAQHQTSHNSGVIHAGVYYAPGLAQGAGCAWRARGACTSTATSAASPTERCGKLIVAKDASEVPALDELERRATENGVPGLRRLTGDQIAEVEPHCVGEAALHSPNTGIVDFAAVARAMADDLRAAGGTVTDRRGRGGHLDHRGRHRACAHTARSGERALPGVLRGAGLRPVAVLAGADPDPRIVPFRGAYLRLRPEKRDLVKGLIYPVPDPSLPFLGVHLTLHVDGEVSLGPTALLAPRRAQPDLARHLADGPRAGGAPALTEMRNAARAARLRPRGGAVRARARARRLQPVLRRRTAPRRWAATGRWSTTS